MNSFLRRFKQLMNYSWMLMMCTILSTKVHSFEHLGHPPDPKTCIDGKTVSSVRSCQSAGAASQELDQWMEGLSAAELLMQFGIDPNLVIMPDGKLQTPDGQ